MPAPDLQQPLLFTPIFVERVWGGERLKTSYGKNLPQGKSIGESWEIVDREEAQSVVASGPLKGRTLHELWSRHHEQIFGPLPVAPRFPLLVKLLDAKEKLSLQVHPSRKLAAEMGDEPKTEFWYFAEADADAEIYVGLKEGSSRSDVVRALQEGTVAEHVHWLRVRRGDCMFLPSGRIHAIGAGNLIVEIQQNSDTTYRVFDWNRTDAAGKQRELHVEKSLLAINFEDREPRLMQPSGETLVTGDLFEVQKWMLPESREVSPSGTFAIVLCLTGKLSCAGIPLEPGQFFLVPASLAARRLCPEADDTSLLRITIPSEPPVPAGASNPPSDVRAH